MPLPLTSIISNMWRTDLQELGWALTLKLGNNNIKKKYSAWDSLPLFNVQKTSLRYEGQCWSRRMFGMRTAKYLACGNRHLLEILGDPSGLEQQSFQSREIYYPCDWVRVRVKETSRLPCMPRALFTLLQFVERNHFVPIRVHLYNSKRNAMMRIS